CSSFSMVARIKSSCDDAPTVAEFRSSLAAALAGLDPAPELPALAFRDPDSKRNTESMTTETACGFFMRNCEFTGRQATKKAAPYGATLLKRRSGQESEESHCGRRFRG